MRFAFIFCLAPCALAGCLPTIEAATAVAPAEIVAAQEPAAAPPVVTIIASAAAVAANVPLPPKRPDFEGVTPASRSLGAIVADAEEVDEALEKASPPPTRPPAPRASQPVQSVAFAESRANAPQNQFAPIVAQTSTSGSILFARGGAARSAGPLNSPGYYAAYDDTNVSCFPAALRDALNTIAAHYKAPVEVTSGLRNRGRAHSLHRYCMAADIRVAGVGPRELAGYAKTVDNVNGVGTYRYNNVTHIDVRQDKMAWRY